MRCPRSLLFSAVITLGCGTINADAQPHREHRLAAEDAYAQRNYAAAGAAIRAALELRPDSPRYLRMLAAVSTLAGDDAGALAALNQIADLGLATVIERDADFATLQGSSEFRRVQQRFADNREPRGEASVLDTLPGRSGIIEGLAYVSRSGELFLGDVHHRCIWRRDRDGRVTRYSAEDEELFGVFGLALDEPRNTLWAATTAVPEMTGFNVELQGLAALAEFNLATSELRRVVHLPLDGREHGLSDLIVAPDGTVYATDSLSPIIWQLAPGAEEFEIVAGSPLFGSLQGLVLERRTLIVADYTNGLFAIDLDRREIQAIPTPKSTTLTGLDGMVAVPGGIVATQNGTDPQRVLHLTLAPDLRSITNVAVLASGQPELQDIGLITLMDSVPTLVANAGWEGFSAAPNRTPATRTVHLLQVPLSLQP
jgi:sugar lactone lactonase YvrE